MNILIIDNHTKHLRELASCFSKTPRIINKEEFEAEPDLEGYDLIVISGGSNIPTALRHPDHYKKEIQLIRDSKTPILGICLGAELIALSFGAELKELPETMNQAIKLGGEKINICEHHRIGFDVLPPELISLAKSEHCIEVFKHVTKPIIGIQFHPEVGHHRELFSWALKEFKLEKHRE